MELVLLVRDALQSGAERVASYRLGQTALRQVDRALWVVEKCARWAVPPPLDQDERPQPELVRPLPWVFFLLMLIALRITREFLSLLNLVMGKPPLRSADVVMYIQSKRRQLRTLQYQGTRLARTRPPAPAAAAAAAAAAWPALADLLRLTMCFRRHPHNNNNNNTTTTITHNDNDNEQVLVGKRSKRGRETSSPVVSGSETTMERLIEKMMVDLDADSDEDSSFTLTNLTSPKSDRSDSTVQSDQETFHNDTQTTQETLLKPQEEPQTTQSETQYCQVGPTTTQSDTHSQEENLEKDTSTTQNDTQPQKKLQTTQPQNEVPTAENEIQPQKEVPIAGNETQPQKEAPTAGNGTQVRKELVTTQKNIDYECDVKEFSSTPEKKIEDRSKRANS